MKNKKLKEWEIVFTIPEEEHEAVVIASTKKKAKAIFFDEPGCDPTAIIKSIKRYKTDGGLSL